MPPLILISVEEFQNINRKITEQNEETDGSTDDKIHLIHLTITTLGYRELG